MATRHVIVDGSNLATEGRNMPSLEQLDQAVREFMAENPTDEVMVVVDASFGHRIDPSEVSAFEAAEEAGEVVSPPAGAIGRGDAFLLRIAEKIGATVLSNDSFQEFHGEHTWLFEKGRLIGGKPVPGVGWIFMDRTPVRGAKSREVVKEAKRRKRAESEEVAATKGADKGAGQRPAEKAGRGRPKAVDRAIARATQEVVEPKSGSKSRRRRGGAPPAEPVNEPLAFITFIAAHPLGSEVVGAVVEYSSHGAFIDADGARCYIPLSAMADPAPRKAREVVAKGESRPFVVQAFDPQRRGIELALPGFAHLAGGPTAETVEAEIRGEAKPAEEAKPARRRRVRAEKPEEAPEVAEAEEAAEAAEAAGGAGPERAAPVKAAARRSRKAPAPVATGEAPAPQVGEPSEAPVAPVAAPAPPPGEPPAPAPRRRRAAPAAAGARAAAGEATPAEPAAPARKRASTRKAAPAPEAVPAEAGAEAVPGGEAPAPRKAAAAKAGSTRATAAKAGATKAGATKAGRAEATAPATAAKKAPARKTAARKTASPAVGSGTGESGSEPAGPTPAPRARKAPAARVTKKAAGDATTPAGTPAEEPGKAAPAKKAARATTRKAAGATEDSGAAAGARAAVEEATPAAKVAPARKTAARRAPARRSTAGEGDGEAPARRRAPSRKAGATTPDPAG